MNRFLDKFVHAKYRCRFSIACNHTRNKGGETNLNVEVEIICERKSRKIYELFYAVSVAVLGPGQESTPPVLLQAPQFRGHP